MSQLKILVLLSILTIVSFVVLVIALTDIYPVKQLTEHKTVVGLGFLMVGGFTRKAFQKYKG